MNRSANYLKVSLVICWLCLASWAICCYPATAGAIKSFAFDTGSSSVEVASIYETSYPAQKGLVKSLKPNTKAMKKAVGFDGASALQSEDGKQVIVLSQWQDLASYQAYTAIYNPGTSPPVPSPTRTLIFEAIAARTSIADATPALRGKEAVVQWVQFSPKDNATESQLLPQIEVAIPDILQKQPIPQSVLLLKAKDTSDIALLTNWNCSATFEDVGKPEAIVPTKDLIALADTQQRLFRVTNIVPMEVKQEEESERGEG